MINTAEMFRMFLPHRGDAIVIPGRGGRHWVSDGRRDSGRLVSDYAVFVTVRNAD